MSKINLLTIAVIGLLLMNIAIVGFLLMRKPPVHPEGRPPMGLHDRPPMIEGGLKKIITDRLHFDKEQEAAYDKLIAEHQAAVKAYDDSIMQAKNNLYQSLKSETFTGRDSLLNRLGALQKQVELIHYEHFAAIKKLCKPGQLENFNTLTNKLSLFFAPVKKDGPPPGD